MLVLYSWIKERGLVSLSRPLACKYPGEKAIVDTLCTHYQYPHMDQKRKQSHFPLSLIMATKTWQFPQRSEARGLAMTSSCQHHTFTQDFTHSRLPTMFSVCLFFLSSSIYQSLKRMATLSYLFLIFPILTAYVRHLPS